MKNEEMKEELKILKANSSLHTKQIMALHADIKRLESELRKERDNG